MSTTTIGWVMDKDTSKRRLHLGLADAGVELRVEVPGQPPATLTLDAQGIEALYAYVGQAFVRTLVGQEHGVPERGSEAPGTLKQDYGARVHRWEAQAHLADALVELVAADRHGTVCELLQAWTRSAEAVFGALLSQGGASSDVPVDVPALLAALNSQFRLTCEEA